MICPSLVHFAPRSAGGRLVAAPAPAVATPVATAATLATATTTITTTAAPALAVTTAATAVAATTAATAAETATLFARARLVDGHWPAPEVAAIQQRYGLSGLSVGTHLNKAIPPALPRELIGDHVR